MSRYELIAFDMDGTLLDSKKKIRNDSIEMISEAVNAKKIVSLSTGRCVAELKEYREQLSDVRYVICSSGALVFDAKSNEEIYSLSLSTDTVHKIMHEIKDFDVMIQMHSTNSIVQKDKVSRMADYQMDIYRRLFEEIAMKLDDIYVFYEQNPIPLYKLNLYFKNRQERTIAKKRLEPYELSFAYAEETSLECSAPNVSKGQGLIKLCEYLNIPIKKTIAVGDADNDLDILEQAGLAIAMGNANENVKKIADVIVCDNDHGGCAQAIRDYLLND